MIKRLRRLVLGLAIGLAALAGVIWILCQTLGDRPTLYQGKMAEQWAELAQGTNTAASNEARAVLASQIIPHLTDVLLNDTNDSKIHLALVNGLNQLPGVYIDYAWARGRRAMAAHVLGSIGPDAAPALPVLIQIAQRTNDDVRGNAITAIGEIRSQPDTVIPLLISFLDDEDLSDEAAEALGHFGPKAKMAVPKILPLLKARDKDTVEAAVDALKQIDPEALAAARGTAQTPVTPFK
jgi:HEAT repeat protein